LPARRIVSIVAPVFNEEAAISAFHEQLSRALQPLPYDFHIFYINDGSKDKTSDVLQSIADSDQRVVVIELSRNFGHQAALTAGLDLADGDFIITLDADGQHPPELITPMLELAETGYEIVLTQRMDEPGVSPFKRSTSALFYRLLNRISDIQILPGGADFRLLSQKAVAGLREMREVHRFLRGMVGWMGYRTAILPYHQPPRLGGKSKYSLAKMLRLSTDAIFSFSLLPLYVIILLGVLFLLLAAAEVIYVLSLWFSRPESLAPGWSSLMFMLLVVGGTMMISMGFIGVYVGYIFQEVKRRPLYLLARIYTQNQNVEIRDLSSSSKRTDP